MAINREDVVQSLGGEAAVARMTHEQRADALEDFQIARLDADMAARKQREKFPTVAELEDKIDKRTWRMGSGKLFRPGNEMGRFEGASGSPNVKRLPEMPKNPSLYDYFALRFAPGTHLLQSAALAKARGEPEEVILACLLHDIGGSLMKADHGYWGAALILPAYYLGDATLTLLLRLRRGERVWQAHREHFYQRAVRSGMSHKATVIWICLFNVGLIGLAFISTAGTISSLASLGGAALIVAVLLWYFARALKISEYR